MWAWVYAWQTYATRLTHRLRDGSPSRPELANQEKELLGQSQQGRCPEPIGIAGQLECRSVRVVQRLLVLCCPERTILYRKHAHACTLYACACVATLMLMLCGVGFLRIVRA